MDAYLIPIKTAILVFIGLLSVISTPVLFWQYRKHGALPFFKAVILYSFIFYMLAAFFMTLLPLPSKEFVATLTTPYTQWVPFRFVKDIMENTNLNLLKPSTYFSALVQPVVLQVIFNVILTIPFGLYLRYYFKQDFKRVLLFSFLLSLFYEMTQITGVYGIYSRPYRIFDVDDLMLNTLGGVVGYALTPLFAFLLPSREDIDQTTKLKAKQVPVIRRIFAYAIDYNVLAAIIKLSTSRINVNPYLIELLIALILGFLYFFLNGKSLGLSLMRLKIVAKNKRKLKLPQALVRSVSFSVVYNIVFKVSMDFFNYLNSGSYIHKYIFAFYVFLMFAVQFILLVHFFYAGVLRKGELFQDKVSQTHLESKL